jgi:abortive infection Abi-like protein
MADLDALAPNYRRAQQRWPGAPTLAKCHEALRACFDSNAHGMVEHVKSFIESVCLTIMGELREPMPSSTPSTTDLLIAALSPLGLRNTRGASKLDKVLSGFNKLADALTEMRNANGPVAHGRDAFLDALTVDHARAFLHTGDAILGVLLSALEGKQPDLTVTREPYESFPHLNERIDRAVSMEARIDEEGERPMVVFSVATGLRGEAIELRVEPSRLLYGIDRSAYIEVLRTADLVVVEGEESEEEEEEQLADLESVEFSGIGRAAATEALTDLVPRYEGFLEPLRTGLGDFLNAEGVDPAVIGEASTRLIDSLLATADQNMGLDWKRREPLQARLKVSCKRVLVRFGATPANAENVAERLVAWLRVQAPENGVGSLLAPVVARGGQS